MQIFKYLFLIAILLPIYAFAATYKCPTVDNFQFTQAWIYGGESSPFQYPALYCWYKDLNSHDHFCVGTPQSADNKFSPQSSKWIRDICGSSSETMTPQDCLFKSDDSHMKYQSSFGNCKFDQVE